MQAVCGSLRVNLSGKLILALHIISGKYSVPKTTDMKNLALIFQAFILMV